jgi:hypothetical protein
MWRNYTIALLGACMIMLGILNVSGLALNWILGIFGIALLVISFWGTTFKWDNAKFLSPAGPNKRI